MTVIYFVRHAEPNYVNRDDKSRELTSKGLADRLFVTRYLENKEIDIVMSSPYKRALDTVKHFAEKMKFEVSIVDDFRERKVDSVWIENFEDFTKRQWDDFEFKLSDGETLKQVQERNINALNLVLHQYKDKNVVIGSHGTALSTVINYYEPSFGYNDFNKIRFLMPWIVKFTFEDRKCVSIEKINLFKL